MANLVRTTASSEDHGNNYFAVDLKTPPLKLVADDISAAPSLLFGKHRDRRIVLFHLVPPTPLAVARSAGEAIAGAQPALCLRGTLMWLPPRSHVIATSALVLTCPPTWRHVISPVHQPSPRLHCVVHRVHRGRLTIRGRGPLTTGPHVSLCGNFSGFILIPKS